MGILMVISKVIVEKKGTGKKTLSFLLVISLFFLLSPLTVFAQISEDEVSPGNLENAPETATEAKTEPDFIPPPGVPVSYIEAVSPYLRNISPENFIHGIIYYETVLLELSPNDPKVEQSYATLEDLIDQYLKRTQRKKLPPEERLFEFYKIILENGFDQRGFLNDKGVDHFIDAISTKEIDCDTGSYLYLAMAEEFGWPVYAVLIPPTPQATGHFFLRWQEPTPENSETPGRTFNFETNTIISNFKTSKQDWDSEFEEIFLKEDAAYEKLYGKKNRQWIDRTLTHQEILLTHILPPLIADLSGELGNKKDKEILDIVADLENRLGEFLKGRGKLAYGFSEAYKDTGVAYYNRSLELARKIRTRQVEADKKGGVQSDEDLVWEIEQFEIARDGFFEALHYFSLSELGPQYSDATKRNLKTLYFDWGQTFLKRGNDYNNIGVRHSIKGNREEAVKAYEMAISEHKEALERVDVLPEEVKDHPFFFRVHKSMGTAYQNWGKTLEDMEQYEKAEEKYRQAFDSFKQAEAWSDAKNDITPTLVNLYKAWGAFYGNSAVRVINSGLNQQKAQEAEAYFSNAIDLLERGKELAPNDKSLLSLLNHIKNNYGIFKKIDF